VTRGSSARRLYDAKCGRCQGLKSWSDIDEYTICNTVSSKAKTGTVIENFSHAGASGGQFILDIEAQVFFSVNAKNQLAWSPVAGISMPTGFYPINVSAIFSGFVIPTVCNEPEQAPDVHPTGKGIGVNTFSAIPPNDGANHGSPLLIPQFWHSGKIAALKHRRHHRYPALQNLDGKPR
jgi:hypothetical protein